MLEELIRLKAPIVYFKKGEILQRAGQKSTQVFYVKKGLLRSYTIDEKGKEHIFMFASEGWMISDIDSQAFHKESVLNIDALEHSEIIPFAPQLLDSSKLTERLDFQQIIDPLMRRIGMMQQRIIALMSNSASKRYESFLDIYPELPNRVPQKMIASYLGITPEALSNIRRKLVKPD